MKASRGCTTDLPVGLYDWDPEFLRCPHTLFDGFVADAYDWYQMWRVTKEGPFASHLTDNPAYVRQAIMVFERARIRAESQANEELERQLNG